MIQEDFIMGIFQDLRNELPPFDNYLTFIFEEKQTKMIGQNTKTLPLKELRCELFRPLRKENRQTDKLMHGMAVEVATLMLKELRDPLKVTADHLSAVGGKFSWDLIDDDIKEAGIGKMANNNCGERPWGVLSYHMQNSTMISPHNAAGVGHAQINGVFSRGEELGEFHKLPLEMRNGL